MWMVVLFFILTQNTKADLNNNLYRKIPVCYSIQLRKNKVIPMHVLIHRDLIYWVELDLHFDKQKERNGIVRIIGQTSKGLSTVFSFTVRDVSGKYIFKKKIKSETASSWGATVFSRRIANIPLISGKYLIEIEPISGQNILARFNEFKPEICLRFYPKSN